LIWEKWGHILSDKFKGSGMTKEDFVENNKYVAER